MKKTNKEKAKEIIDELEGIEIMYLDKKFLGLKGDMKTKIHMKNNEKDTSCFIFELDEDDENDGWMVLGKNYSKRVSNREKALDIARELIKNENKQRKSKRNY